MRLKYRLALWLLLCVCLALPMFASAVCAQTEPAYYVTVKPTIENAIVYQSVDASATLSFEAQWTYGPNEGQNIQNALVTFTVNNADNQKIDTLSANTTSGVFTFNYTSATPQVLSFNPTKLVTADNQEYTANPTAQAGVIGLAAHSAQVWWDTFHVELVDHDTSQSGHVSVSVNVTRLMLPEEGLFVGSLHIDKIVQHANVTINGVKAQETQTGIYTAESSTWLPTAYVYVSVEQHGATGEAGFSFTQNANSPIWTYAAVFASLFCTAALMVKFMLSRRVNNASVRHLNFPFLGAFFLAASSAVSLYWGAVGLVGTGFGFSWLLLCVLGVFSFIFGLSGVVMALRKRYQAAIIFALILPLLTNVVAVKASLDSYQLANPWLILFTSLLLSLAAAFFVANSEEIFQHNQTGQKQPI